MNAKKYLWVLISLLFLVALCMIFLFHLKSDTIKMGDYTGIKASGMLRVVMEYNASDYYVSGDSITGAQYELCKFISRKSGLELNISFENNLEASITKLLNKEVDIISQSIPITTGDKEVMAFTIPIKQSKQVLVQRKKASENDSSYINSQIQLAHKTIYLPQGSPTKLRIKNLSEEIAEPIYVKEIDHYSQEHILYMVAFGDIDYAVVDYEIASKNRNKFPEIDMNIDISFSQLQAWAVRKESPILLDSLNVWISEYQSLSLR